MSLPLNLSLISSKPKFLSKMFLLVYFSVSSLNLHYSRDSKLLTLMCCNKSRFKLKHYYYTWGVGSLLYYMKFYSTYTMGIDYYKWFFSNLMYCQPIIPYPSWHSTLGRAPLGPLFSILKELSNVYIACPSSRVATGIHSIAA